MIESKIAAADEPATQARANSYALLSAEITDSVRRINALAKNLPQGRPSISLQKALDAIERHAAGLIEQA